MIDRFGRVDDAHRLTASHHPAPRHQPGTGAGAQARVAEGARAWIAELPAPQVADERQSRLNTVCEEARCPNIGECWHHGTATFMILGDVCTRACGYCAVPHGMPSAVDAAEPARLAEAVRTLGLRYVVITSVDRDDLPTAARVIFAETIRRVRVARAGLPRRSAHPRFPGHRVVVANGARRGPGRPESQHRDRAAPVSPGAPGRPLPADAGVARPRADDRAGDPDEDRASSSASARSGTRSWRRSTTCARWASRFSPSASICAPQSRT